MTEVKQPVKRASNNEILVGISIRLPYSLNFALCNQADIFGITPSLLIRNMLSDLVSQGMSPEKWQIYAQTIPPIKAHREFPTPNNEGKTA